MEGNQIKQNYLKHINGSIFSAGQGSKEKRVSLDADPVRPKKQLVIVSRKKEEKIDKGLKQA